MESSPIKKKKHNNEGTSEEDEESKSSSNQDSQNNPEVLSADSEQLCPIKLERVHSSAEATTSSSMTELVKLPRRSSVSGAVHIDDSFIFQYYQCKVW